MSDRLKTEMCKIFFKKTLISEGVSINLFNLKFGLMH